VPWSWGQEEPFEGLLKRDREETLRLFHADRLAGGASPEDADTDRDVADDMLRFRANDGEDPLHWTPDAVEDYLFQVCPHRRRAKGEDPKALPGRVDAFLEWLGRRDDQLPWRLQTVRKRVAECAAEFLEVVGGQRASGSPEQAEQRSPGKAWVWNGDGPPPDPKGPCPCGSGRRHHKCCMPR
jgi:hypothetical protein